jgi:hypothetical protein
MSSHSPKFNLTARSRRNGIIRCDACGQMSPRCAVVAQERFRREAFCMLQRRARAGGSGLPSFLRIPHADRSRGKAMKYMLGRWTAFTRLQGEGRFSLDMTALHWAGSSEKAVALRHDTHFMAAKVSTTLRLLTLILPMPG